MNVERLRQAETVVRELSKVLEPVETKMWRQIPDEHMREAYRVLRAQSVGGLISKEQFDRQYKLFDALSDSMREPAKQEKAAANCFEFMATLPKDVRLALDNSVKMVVSKMPKVFVRPNTLLYQWARKVFSDAKLYQSHILQSRDESTMSVSEVERSDAVKDTSRVMREICDMVGSLSWFVDESTVLEVRRFAADIEAILHDP